MDHQAKRPPETPVFSRPADDDADWDVSTDVSPPAGGFTLLDAET